MYTILGVTPVYFGSKKTNREAPYQKFNSDVNGKKSTKENFLNEIWTENCYTSLRECNQLLFSFDRTEQKR